MITKLDSLNDIANEFGVPLTTAKNISYYYNNKNPDSPVQPVMTGGRITDWIGYDHHASSSIVIQVWYEKPPTGRDFFRFFYTSSDYNEAVSHLPTGFISLITIYNSGGGFGITTKPQVQKLNTDTSYMNGAVGYSVAWQTDCRPYYNSSTGIGGAWLVNNVDTAIVHVSHKDFSYNGKTVLFSTNFKRCLHWT